METTPYLAIKSNANLLVFEQGAVRSVPLDFKMEWTIGRNIPGNNQDISLESKIASRQHGVLTSIDGVWYFTDKGSSNGTYYNGVKISNTTGEKIKPVILKNGDIFRIDCDNLENPDDRGVWMMFTTGPVGNQWQTVKLRKNKTIIGRDAEICDVVIPLPYISGKHMIVERKEGRFYVMDCDSMVGTWLNNVKVTGETLLHEKDHIALCDCTFIFAGNALIYNVPVSSKHGKTPIRSSVVTLNENSEQNSANIKSDFTEQEDQTQFDDSKIILKANIETKKVPNNSGSGEKELIRDVQVEVKEGSLVALLGGSGAGKTTVMNCLNGMETKGVTGTVEFQGVDLLHNFERMKYLIGSVPQEQVFHPSLTVESELKHAAKRRLPGDTKSKEINEHADKAIEQLGLTNIRKNKISKCSGGEQKRVNIGIELVADRRLLCLDEPDAGLDPGTKKELFTILRNLAHEEDKSILVIIHDVSDIELFDQIIMMTKVDNVGRLAFSGSPAEGREYFGTDLKGAYALLAENPEKYVKGL